MMETDASRERDCEQVTSLRQWGSDVVHALPPRPDGPWIVGTAPGCAMQLVDRHAAPEHAELKYDGDHWMLHDRGTPVRQDGVPRSSFALEPGMEVSIGATTLVAESQRTTRLRELCRRLLGWGGDRWRAVDHALRAIRLARTHRSSLVLCGDGDLVPIAHALHRCTLGPNTPFIMCDPRRHDGRGDAGSPPNVPRAVEAFARAAGGTLCLRARRLPPDVQEVLRRVWEPDSAVQLVVCTRRQHPSVALHGNTTIHLPPLQIREMELSRIVQEYADDAVAALGAMPGDFTDGDRRWVLAHCAHSLPEIEKATLRIVALAVSGSASQAAALLGTAPVSLVRWFAHRPGRSDGQPASSSSRSAPLAVAVDEPGASRGPHA